jgi:hypothetical protein
MNVNLNLDEGLLFFNNFMYLPLQEKKKIYESRNIRLGSMIPSSDWEVFASLLIGQKGNGVSDGVDLDGYEVKSLSEGTNYYEYQYHKNTGMQKLDDDIKVGHLFFSHSDFLRKVELRYIHGSVLSKDYFDVWKMNYPNPYPQRYRNGIPRNWVQTNGQLLMTIQDGKNNS